MLDYFSNYIINFINFLSNSNLSFLLFFLFLWAFFEAIFFPFPVELPLLFFIAEYPSFAFLFFIIAFLGSFFGSELGYRLGFFIKRRLFYSWFEKKLVKKVKSYYDYWGSKAVFIAGLTPLPYKLFTVSAGFFHINHKHFLLSAFLSRFLRFFLVTVLTVIFLRLGKELNITYLNKLLIFLLIIVALFYLFLYLNKFFYKSLLEKRIEKKSNIKKKNN